MKKTRSKKSRDTVPLSHFLRICILRFKNYSWLLTFSTFLYPKNAEFYTDFKSVEMIEKYHPPKRLFAKQFLKTMIQMGNLQLVYTSMWAIFPMFFWPVSNQHEILCFFHAYSQIIDKVLRSYKHFLETLKLNLQEISKLKSILLSNLDLFCTPLFTWTLFISQKNIIVAVPSWTFEQSTAFTFKILKRHSDKKANGFYFHVVQSIIIFDISKVPKREIFDRSDFPDFYTIKSSWVGDLLVKILSYYFNFSER